MMFVKVAGFEERIGNQFMKGQKEFNISTDFSKHDDSPDSSNSPTLYIFFFHSLFILNELSACYKIMFHTHQLSNYFVKELQQQQQQQPTVDKANLEYINTLSLFCFSLKLQTSIYQKYIS
jgi:hypothetical protein